MLTRKEIEQRENKFLAPYAMHSKDTRGRFYPEEETKYRSCYQRDRDRIIHSIAFRRLEYKTQVFVNHEGDYYRTRLTHSLEVSQIGRSIARILSLNEDLVEGIALAHDIGHPPFGHAGEDTLSLLMEEEGGFDHNLQGLRVVDKLERRYPLFPGLNLSWELREGINKHTTMFDKSKRLIELEPELSPTLETQVVDIADEIAYDNHDIDDGFTSSLLSEKSLEKLELYKEALNYVKKRYVNLSRSMKKYQIVRFLIDSQIKDLVVSSDKNIKKMKIKKVKDVRKYPNKLILFSKSMQKKRNELRNFLIDNLYKHYRVVRMSYKAKRFITELFNIYKKHPEQLPPPYQLKLKEDSISRVVCDYIAGMTDRFALDEYKKLFDPYEKV